MAKTDILHILIGMCTWPKLLHFTGICDTGRRFRHNFHTLRGLLAPTHYTVDTARSRPMPGHCRRSQHTRSSSCMQRLATETRSLLQSAPLTAPSSLHDATSLACDTIPKMRYNSKNNHHFQSCRRHYKSVTRQKVKEAHTPKESRRSAHLPYIGQWACRRIYHYYLWRMASATPDLQLPSLPMLVLIVLTHEGMARLSWPGW